MGLINCLTCREDFGEKEQEEEYYRQLNQKAADSHELRRRFQEEKRQAWESNPYIHDWIVAWSCFLSLVLAIHNSWLGIVLFITIIATRIMITGADNKEKILTLEKVYVILPVLLMLFEGLVGT